VMDDVIARRQALGQDRFDEVWNGEYHMNPGATGRHACLDSELIVLLHPHAKAAGLHASTGFNLGDGPTNYRVPDGGYHRIPPVDTWIPTAAIVVEIQSPVEETYAKFDFYLDHGVEEIIVVDSLERTVRCFARTGSPGSFTEEKTSRLLGVTTSWITDSLSWP
ncbi:MAG: Uma2 family endonuclease, partial [Actinomycetota bacterium]|nr:Uma2 family endonuclease [Actinomycetota bacterium]